MRQAEPTHSGRREPASRCTFKWSTIPLRNIIISGTPKNPREKSPDFATWGRTRILLAGKSLRLDARRPAEFRDAGRAVTVRRRRGILLLLENHPHLLLAGKTGLPGDGLDR